MRWVAPIAVLLAATAVAGATAAPSSVMLIRPALERDLIRAYPALRCQQLPTTVAVGTTYVSVDERTCTLFGASGRRTTFISGWRRRTTLVPLLDWPRRARVLEVGVAAGR